MPVVAVAVLRLVIVGVLALIGTQAYKEFARWLGQMTPDWHIPGFGNLRSKVVGLAESAYGALDHWWNSQVDGAAGWLLAPFHYLDWLTTGNIEVMKEIYAAQTWIVGHAEHLWRDARGYAHSLYVDAYVHGQYLYQLAERGIHDARAFVVSHGAWLLAEAIQHADWIGRVAHKELEAARAFVVSHGAWVLAEAIKHADWVRRESALYTDGQIHLAKLYAGRIADDIAHSVTSTFSTTIRAEAENSWTDVRREVVELQGVVDEAMPGLSDLVGNIPRVLPRGLEGALAGIIAAEIPMLRYTRECGVKLCNGLGSLAGDLPKLLELAEGAAFLGFVVEMIEQPKRTADDTYNIVGTVLDDTVGEFRRVTGV